MAITTTRHTTALRTGTTGPSGSALAYSSEPALGSAVRTTSTVTWTTASIRSMATLVHIRNAARRPLIISMEMKCATDAVTLKVAIGRSNRAHFVGRQGIPMRCCTSWIVRTVAVLAVLLGAFGLQAGASATLLIEEPYGKLGFFTATGHAAVYLSGVCAQTPLILRRCAPGESGVVLSRYDGVQGYDWIAIPLVPYLYAVERPEDVPLFAALQPSKRSTSFPSTSRIWSDRATVSFVQPKSMAGCTLRRRKAVMKG